MTSHQNLFPVIQVGALCRKPSIVLEELNLPYKVTAVSIRGEVKEPW